MLRDARPLAAPLRAKAPREHRVQATVLRQFIGNPRWSRWKELLAEVGLPTSGRTFTRAECRRVMEAWYRDVGAFRLKRWRATP